MNDDLYQADLLALARDGRAVPRIENATVSARVDNPVCGDRVTIDLVIDGDRIAAVGAKVQGCALCQAATALIAANAVGHPIDDLRRTADAVTSYLQGDDVPLPWGRLSSFAPVRTAKSRWECGMLPCKASLKAADQQD